MGRPLTNEAEIEAAARALFAASYLIHTNPAQQWEEATSVDHQWYRQTAAATLAAARAAIPPSERPRCSHHNIELVPLTMLQGQEGPRTWACPVAAMHDLCVQFDALYQANYSTPTGENGIYHHALRVVESSERGDGDGY